MLHFFWDFAQKFWEPAVTDLAADLRALAPSPGEGVKIHERIACAARRAGLAYWRAYDIWYGKARRIEMGERRAVEAALQAKREDDARNELHELRIRLERLESLFVQTDPNFHRPSADYVRDQIRKMDGGRGAQNRPVASLEKQRR